MNINALLHTAVALTRKHTPLILTATAVAGVVSTSVLAAKAARPAYDAVIDLANDRWVVATDTDQRTPADHFEELTIMDKAKATWKIWLPPVVSGALTITSIVLIHTTHQKRYAALMGLYVLGEKAFQEYREAVDEVVPEKVKEKVKTAVAKKAVDREDPPATMGAVDPDNPDTHPGWGNVCYDCYSGRYFTADMQTIRRAENDFNQDLINHRYGSLNEFYARLGLSGIDAGEDIGWNSDKLLNVGYNSILTDAGVPVLSIDFHDSRPKIDYSSSW